MKISVPPKLNIVCATAVLLAFTDAPTDAIRAVIVVPILLPNKIGKAPVNPITDVTPSGPGVAAKFCRTAITADDD